MSIPHLNAAWTARIADPQAKLVLVRLADRADKTTSLCWPSLSDLVADTELGRSTVCRKLDMLEQLGWIIRNRLKNGCEYTINLAPNQSQSGTTSPAQPVPERDHLETVTSVTAGLVPERDQSQSGTQPVPERDLPILENPKEPKIYIALPKAKEDGKEPIPFPEIFPEKSPYPTLSQAIEYGKTIRMSEQAATFWWEVRDSAGWTKSQSGGGVARKITGWQSDMSVSIPWAEKGAHERKAALNSSPATGTVVIGGRTFRA